MIPLLRFDVNQIELGSCRSKVRKVLNCSKYAKQWIIALVSACGVAQAKVKANKILIMLVAFYKLSFKGQTSGALRSAYEQIGKAI